MTEGRKGTRANARIATFTAAWISLVLLFVIVIPRLSFSSSVGTVFLLFLDFPVPLSASPMLLLHKTKLLLFSSLRWLGHAHIFCLAGVVMVLIGGWSGY